MKSIFTFSLAALLTSTLAVAAPPSEGGGGIRNGGELNEIKLGKLFDRLTNFLGTRTGMDLFPEVTQAQFIALRSELTITIKDGELRDSLGELRSELNFRDPDTNAPVIQFARNDLRNYLGDEGELYVILMHSGLNLLDKELARAHWTKTVKPSSIYILSRRILPHVATLNADGDFPTDQLILCGREFRRGRKVITEIYTFDLTGHRVVYSHVQAGLRTWNLAGPPAPFVTLSIRELSLRGNSLAITYLNPNDPSYLDRADITLADRRAAGAIGEFSAAKIWPHFTLAEKQDEISDLIPTFEQSPPPGVKFEAPAEYLVECALIEHETSEFSKRAEDIFKTLPQTARKDKPFRHH